VVSLKNKKGNKAMDEKEILEWQRDKVELKQFVNSKLNTLIFNVLSIIDIVIPLNPEDGKSEITLRHRAIRKKILDCINDTRRDINVELENFIMKKIGYTRIDIAKGEGNARKKVQSKRESIYSKDAQSVNQGQSGGRGT